MLKCAEKGDHLEKQSAADLPGGIALKWIRGLTMRATLVVAWAPALFLVPSAGAVPLQDDAAGRYTDELSDSTGLSFMQNVKVGPNLTPGARVSPGNWQWAQPGYDSADVIETKFSDPASRFSLTEVPVCATCLTDSETVGLWMRDIKLCDMRGPAVISTTTVENGKAVCYIKYGPVADLYGKFAVTGPYQTGLAPMKEYTVTFRIRYCDDPKCDVPSSSLDGAELGVLDVTYGDTQVEFRPIKLGVYTSATSGDFYGENVSSPVTLEWQVPSPLPPGNGWEYRLKLTLATTGGLNCGATNSCNATVWLDSITVMAKGRAIVEPEPPACGFRKDPCPLGTIPCRCECIEAGLACGWDTSSEFTDSGSYLSPVFDSLSENTVWQWMVWQVEQNHSNGWPRTPVGIKWRVGNDPDPSTWEKKPGWFKCAIPNSVTCYGERDNCSQFLCDESKQTCSCDTALNGRNTTVFPCWPAPGAAHALPPYPLQMNDEDCVTLYKDCSLNGEYSVTKATGRYFQYEADFTSWFANGRYPPEREKINGDYEARYVHDVARPLLKSMRVYYKPARGRIISRTITPAQLKRWKSVVYVPDLETGGSVQVDVLDANNTPLFSNIPSGFSLAGLPVASYPSLRLRATVDNAGSDFRRPSLKSWGLQWENFTESLQVNCNSISLSQSQRCAIIVSLPGTRQGSLLIHDASGELIKELHRGSFIGGIPTRFAWDGTNSEGIGVTPGVYFLTLRAKEIKRSVRIAVLP